MLSAKPLHDSVPISAFVMKVVSPAIQPRALWALVPNLELASTMDATWMLLMRTLAAALSANEDFTVTRK